MSNPHYLASSDAAHGDSLGSLAPFTRSHGNSDSPLAGEQQMNHRNTQLHPQFLCNMLY
jgi:hypothetical protein